MSVVKNIFALVATAAVSYFAPQFAPMVAKFLGVSAFLGSVIGATILAVGLYAIQSIFMGGGGRGTDMEAGKVNVRIPEPPRWLNAGLFRQGGGVLFAEFDGAGNFWYLVVHSDSILTNKIQYFADDEPISLDANGVVLNKEFRLKDNKEKDPADVDGEGIGYVQLWTTTYTENNPTPPGIAALSAAFPGVWTSDHKLVGTTYTVVKMSAIEIEHRYKIYRWRGAVGIGEPGISIAGDWSNMYDPRDPTQVLGDRSTYKPSRNAAIVWAWFRTHPYGRRKPESSINWERVAEQADICDQTVTGLDGTTKRYECGIGIPENKQRIIAEQEILLTMDGQLVFDEDGKVWARAGAWYTPTLTLTRNRDIVAMESVEASNGESETQGVIVRYIDPAARYTAQPSAAWLNPLYYVPGETPQFLVVDVLACHNHNQAMRLAKAIGMRSQPAHKIAPTSNIRGLKARQERIFNLVYDNVFAGDYEIATQVEVDAVGVFCGFGAVPITPDRWDLLPGEESPKPVYDGVSSEAVYPPIVGATVSYSNGRIVLTLPAIPRPDAIYVAQYIETANITGSANDPWFDMTINGTTGESGPVGEGVQYTVRYRYVTGSGRGPAWTSTTITPAVTLLPPTNFQATNGSGQIQIAWRNPIDNRFLYTRTFRNTTADINTAIDVSGMVSGGLGQFQGFTDVVGAGTYYYWIKSYDGLGNESSPVGPITGVAT